MASGDSSKNITTSSLKKKIVALFLVISLGVILIYGFISVLSSNFEDFLYDETPVGNSIIPYEPNFEEDIFKDPEYMELDRLICYTDDLTGLSVSIDETNYATYNEVVTFMFEYINSIIHGDTAFYNDCYNDLYIDKEGKQSDFTMQKLYDIEFCVLTSGTDSLTGKDYCKLWLDYKIFKNNITLRNDIGSDVCRRQYLTLVKESTGEYKIQAVNTNIVEPTRTLNVSRAILFVLAGVVILAGIVVAAVVIIKKTGASKAPVKDVSREAVNQVTASADKNEKDQSEEQN